MPRCFVERCHNYGGRRLNIILHSFPNNLEKIKTWLRSMERSGHVIRDMEELAQRIFEGKTNNRFRVCSEHFTQQSYQPSGLRKTLRKDAVPTIFRDVPPQKCPWQKAKPAPKKPNVDPSPTRGAVTSPPPGRHCVYDPVNPSRLLDRCSQANEETTTGRSTKETREGHRPGLKRADVTHVILSLTLEIICLLTGEDYIVVKKTSSHGEGWRRDLIMEPPPDSLIRAKNNERKILKLTSRIMELLTREKCEIREDRQQHVGMGSHHTLASLGEMVNGLRDPTPARIMAESASCDTPAPPDHGQQNVFSDIKVEAVSYDGGDPNTSTDGPQHYPPTPIKEEPDSCDEGSVTELEIQAPTDHTHQPHASPLIKEEPVSCGHLTDQYIKEEPLTYEAGTVYIPTDPVDHCSPAPMEEPTSRAGEGLTNPPDPSSHGIAEPVLCDERRPLNTDTYVEAQPSSAPTEGDHEDAPNTYSLDTDIYALIKHAQAKYTFTRIEDGSSSEEEENLKDTDPPGDPTQPRPPTGEAVPQTFQCPDCSECFTRKSGLINHRRNHRQEKLTCSKCGKVFSKRSSLQNHLTLHTGEKPYACPICGKCFARKSNLISHETIHSGKASFICAECGRYFVCKVHLTKHQIIHEK